MQDFSTSIITKKDHFSDNANKKLCCIGLHWIAQMFLIIDPPEKRDYAIAEFQ